MAFRLLRAMIWSQRALLLWALLLVIVVLGWAFFNQDTISQYLSNYHRRNAIREEVDRLEEDTSRLEIEREVLAKGGFEIEKVARERFRLSKPGEHVFYLNKTGENDPTTASASMKSKTLDPRAGRKSTPRPSDE